MQVFVYCIHNYSSVVKKKDCSRINIVISNTAMQLKQIAEIWSGYLNRAGIRPSEAGTHYLVQARDLDSHELVLHCENLVRFDAVLSPSDQVLAPGDILFMARGSRNSAILLQNLPENVLAAACFFVIRVNPKKALPGFVCWYLNQCEAQHYFRQQSGSGVHMPVVRRAVLETVEVPLPPMDTQRKIAELVTLRSREEELLRSLEKKRGELISAVCMQAALLAARGGAETE